ncbi:BrnA antitoxin family protein [Desulfocurvibacter africanus]|uniref:BrnA antitoxin family protein n=1 Tax=Desulfocurvibacter africanus TaxID=873 RepID=UPI000426950E|nr:BrnA antitoxin family protein [Desulfocurvibacter africanus]
MSRKADVVRMTSEEARRIRSETDEARVEAIRDEEITRRAQEDPDNPPVDEEFLAGDWERTDLRQAKKPVTIRLDSEVIDWFKRGDRCGLSDAYQQGAAGLRAAPEGAPGKGWEG